jgi:hypothetical protein
MGDFLGLQGIVTTLKHSSQIKSYAGVLETLCSVKKNIPLELIYITNFVCFYTNDKMDNWTTTLAITQSNFFIHG